jgi:hypothetical protein
VLYAYLKWFKQSKFKNPKGCKKPKERWWVLSKWNGGLENKCVGGWVFTFSANDDLLVALKFELTLQKKEETL